MSVAGINTPARRAAAAASGAAVGVVGWLVTEQLRHPEGKLWASNFADGVLQGSLYAAPIAASALVGWALATRRPHTSSLAFACVVTAGGVATGAGAFTLAGLIATHRFWPHEALMLFAMALVFGLVRVGPLALAVGWLTVFLADRWAARPPA